MGKFRSLQVLRFVAAVMVVHYHALGFTSRTVGAVGVLGAGYLPKIGTFGVDVFFVISGFVITLTGPLSTPRRTGTRFFWLRWSRVVPFFWLMSAPWIIRMAANGQLNWGQTTATFLFWPALSGSAVFPYLSVGWTLCFEMMFYSAVSITLIGGRLSRNLKVGGLVVIALLIARSLGWPPAHFLANPIFIEFGFGAALAWACPWLRRQNPKGGAAIIAACIGLIAAAGVWGVGDAWDWKSVLNDTGVLFRVAVFGVPAALLVAGALICEPWVQGRWSEVFVRLGDSSYALYLVHPFVLLTIGAFWTALPVKPIADIMTLTGIAACVAAGWAVHLYIERPILRDVRALGRSVGARLQRQTAIA